MGGERWNSMLCSRHTIKTAHEHNVVLHRRSKSRAFQSCTPNPFEQHRSQVDTVMAIPNAFNQEAKEVYGGLVQNATVLDSDMIDHIPRILLAVSRCCKMVVGLLTLSKVLIRHSNGRCKQFWENGDYRCQFKFSPAYSEEV